MNTLDTLDFIREQLYLAHGWFLGTVKGLTDEQANFELPGTGHPISAIIQHLLFVEDDTVNRRIGGGLAIWETGSWEAQIGPKLTGGEADTYRAFRAQLRALDEYRRAVWASSDQYLAGISDADLLRTLRAGEQEQTVARAIGILLNHTAIHVGEISAAKGFQGLRGSPL